MIFYAKSNPKETIREHTDQLLQRFEQLYELNKNCYPYMKKHDWEILKLAVQYHDVGKADIVFQNKIRRFLEEPTFDEGFSHKVQHNFMSILTIPYEKLNLDNESSYLLTQAIGYHHERNGKITKEKELLIENYQGNIRPIIKELEAHMGIEIASKLRKVPLDWLETRITPADGELFYRYIMIKGLLHRLDHASSAHVSVEMATSYAIHDYVINFIDRKFNGKMRPLQLFAKQNQDNHVLVRAQTGMGKTEAGLLWIGDNKGFLTLPLRVSINAMYKRIRDDKTGIGFSSKKEFPNEEEKAIGLLHSTSLDYLYDVSEAFGDSDTNLELVHQQSRQFANKLIISTIDQILKFPLFYRGFEKELATLAGAKVIIDEMQGYNPRIAALIIRAMELIDKVGGKFMIMTATMPDLYRKALEKQLGKSRVPLVQDQFIDDSIIRHHIQLIETSIIKSVDEVACAGKFKKILVICNTVKQAKQMYHNLRDGYYNISVNLLHSMFIHQDRANKEMELLQFADEEGANGIWITTQLVEASLDIDFDMLYTEMSSLDSLFQRLGRCNRKGEKPYQKTNVHIFTGEVSGIGDNKVYHSDIYERSLEIMKERNQSILLESEKMRMIEKLYDVQELEGTNFKEEFEKTLDELTNRPPYEMDSNEAQQLLRDIRQVQVIPQQIFYEVQNIIESYDETSDRKERRQLRREIEKHTVGVNEFLATNKGLLSKSGIPESMRELFIIECEYSKETGLELDKKVDRFL